MLNKLNIIYIKFKMLALDYVNWLINKLDKLIPHDYRYIGIVTIWCILLFDGKITVKRLIVFFIIIIIIYIYKWLYINIWKINNYININQMILLKIYKYKNPLILILIKMEIKIFYIIYNLKKKSINPWLVKLIYNILYNITGINGLKIVLYKFYNILEHWISNKMYELIFQRMFGMILSIMIFTNVIQAILKILNAIYPSYIIWIYIFLVIIPYILTLYNLIDIEEKRININLLWNLLKNINQNTNWYNICIINPVLINNEFTLFLGVSHIKEVLNYNNFLIYLILKIDFNLKIFIEYNKPFYLYVYEIKEFFNTDYIYTKNLKIKNLLKNNNDLDLINYCEYKILLYKLIVFYVWDIEYALGINDSLLTIIKDGYDDIIPVLPVEKPQDAIMISFDYNFNQLLNIYNNKINDIKLNKFWNLIENKEFYNKMHNYLYDYTFEHTAVYKKLKNLKEFNCTYNIYTEKGSNYEQQENEVKNQLNSWRSEWLSYSNKEIELKYYVIFNKIQIIKNIYK